jgi:hypothetical protein
VQFHRALGIGVRHRMHEPAHAGVDVEFFAQFAAERFGVGFAGFTFPAGEFPVPGQVGAAGTQREQIAAV